MTEQQSRDMIIEANGIFFTITQANPPIVDADVLAQIEAWQARLPEPTPDAIPE